MKFKHKSMINLKNLNKYRSIFLNNFFEIKLFKIFRICQNLKLKRNGDLRRKVRLDILLFH